MARLSRIGVVLFVLALLTRLFFFDLMMIRQGGASYYLGDNGTGLVGHDTQHYVAIAKNLVERGAYSRFVDAPFEPDALRTPLLALYFVPFVYAFGFSYIWFAILILIIILSFTPIVVYRLALLVVSSRASFLVALFTAVSPLLAYRSSIAEPDALVVFLVSLTVYYLVNFFQFGIDKDLYKSATILSLATLAKPVGVYLAIIIAFFTALYLLNKKMSISYIGKRLGAYLLIVLVIISPWLIRNKIVFGVWTVSSIATYNAYEYYTASLRYDGEPTQSYPVREAVRNPAYAQFFNNISLERIKRAPLAYARLHLTGTVRNLLASDLTAFAFNSHLKLLPFDYSPDSKNFFYYAWKLLLSCLYILILKRLYDLVHNKEWGRVVIMILFLTIYFYFIFTPANFVDAKYRLPALPLLLITLAMRPSQKLTQTPTVFRKEATFLFG